MFRTVRGLLTLTMAVGVMLPMIAAAQSENHSTTVYVMTNAADKNEVVAYERGNDGSFSESHRYSTEGRGSGGINDPLQAQGSLTLSQDRSLLFAANAGSGNISVFRVRHGHLRLVDKVPSGGSEPVAIAQRQDLVYVLNAGGSGSIVAFRLDNNDEDAHLKQISDSTVYLTAAGSGGSSLTISPDGKSLVATERIPDNIDTFQIKSNGTLAPIVVNQSTAPGVFAATFAPDGKLIVSETGPAGASNASAISSYSVLANGTISAISQSLPTLGNANCWNAITPNGKWVYVSNAASSTIAGFTIGQGGTLTPIGATIVATNPQGSVNLDIAVSSDGKYLYSINSGAGSVGIFAIQSDGTLTNLGDISGLPIFAGFNGIAAL